MVYMLTVTYWMNEIISTLKKSERQSFAAQPNMHRETVPHAPTGNEVRWAFSAACSPICLTI